MSNKLTDYVNEIGKEFGQSAMCEAIVSCYNVLFESEYTDDMFHDEHTEEPQTRLCSKCHTPLADDEDDLCKNCEMDASTPADALSSRLVEELYDIFPDISFIQEKQTPDGGIALRYDFRGYKNDAKKYVDSKHCYDGRVTFGHGHSEYAPERQDDWIIIK